MKRTKWSFAIPELLKWQIENGLGTLEINYFPREKTKNGRLYIELGKYIEITMTYQKPDCSAKSVHYWNELCDTSFEDWFDELVRKIPFIKPAN